MARQSRVHGVRLTQAASCLCDGPWSRRDATPVTGSPTQRLLISIRIARSAADLGLASVAVFSEDDAQVPHTRACDQALPRRGLGPAP